MSLVIDIQRPRSAVRPGTSFVEVLRWPAEADQRRTGRAAGRACLWLLAVGELPPEPDVLEDWVRLPIDDDELDERIRGLADEVFFGRRLEAHAVRVIDGLLTYGGQRLTIPPLEAIILNRLGETPEHVVTREELVKLAWSDEQRRPAALGSRIYTLRCRLSDLDLTIHAIRARGYLLAAVPRVAIPPAPGHEPNWSTRWPHS